VAAEEVDHLAQIARLVWQSAWQSTSCHQMDRLVLAGRDP
jgi:hypothetical protein